MALLNGFDVAPLIMLSTALGLFSDSAALIDSQFFVTQSLPFCWRNIVNLSVADISLLLVRL